MDQFIGWYCSEPRRTLNRTVVLRFRVRLRSLGLAAGTINRRLAAVRRLAYEAADSGLLSPEPATGILRVKGVKQLECRAGNWLNQDQARLLLEKATVPIPAGEACHRQMADSCIRRDGARIQGGQSSRNRLGNGISENVVWYLVRSCALRQELERLARRDLRRTCAKLCHVNGGDLQQIQFLLGHASVLTTERYLGCKQDSEDTVNHRFGCLLSVDVDLRKGLESPSENGLEPTVVADLPICVRWRVIIH